MYKIFDLCIASNIPLPELESCDTSSPDIEFNLSDEKPAYDAKDVRWLHQWKTPDGDIFCSCGRTEDGFVLRFPRTLDFRISNNERRITCSSFSNIPQSTVRHLLIDQVVPRVLGHQGSLIVHGSAVTIDGKAVAFVGESGLGKSTLAAFLHMQGHRILTDDCFKLNDDTSTGILVTPAYPGIRLFKDSSSEVLGRPSRGEVAHYTSKKRTAIEAIEETADHTLSAIFFLASENNATNQDVEISPVSGLQRVMKLVGCSFGLYGETTDELRSHFHKQGHLANSRLHFLQLSYPRQYQKLPTVSQRILEVLRESPVQ